MNGNILIGKKEPWTESIDLGRNRGRLGRRQAIGPWASHVLSQGLISSVE